jgi:transposase-like protein
MVVIDNSERITKMSVQRRNFSSEFKAKVALTAIKGQQTVNEIASTFGIHPNQVLDWKKVATTAVPEAFAQRRARVAADDEAEKAQLYQHIGQLKVELDWLKKKSGLLVGRETGFGRTRA